ncbi:MAG TPA: proline dehydrogenase family protein [Verrucomicrobiae bacterium]|nr:proline dehydrogenase family protein [Verrucomicrobiae bacterium]
MGQEELYRRYPLMLEVALAKMEFAFLYPEENKKLKPYGEGGVLLASPLTSLEEMLRIFPMKAGQKILDVGGGDGLSSYFMAIASGAHVTSIEIDPARFEYLKAFESFLAGKGLRFNVSFVNADFLEHPIGEYDLIYFYFTEPQKYKGRFGGLVVDKLEKELKPRQLFISPAFYLPNELKGFLVKKEGRAQHFENQTRLSYHEITLGGDLHTAALITRPVFAGERESTATLEKTAAGPLLEELDLLKYEPVFADGAAYGTARITLPAIEDPAKLQPGAGILQNILAPVREFDLLYNRKGRLIGAFPAFTMADEVRLSPDDVHYYLDLRKYYAVIPELGAADAKAAWSKLDQEVKEDEALIQDYLRLHRGWPLSAYTAGHTGAYLYAEVDLETGESVLEEFDPETFDAARFNIRKEGKFQIVVPLYPGVYSPANPEFKVTDKKYHRGIYVPSAQLGTEADVLDFQPQHTVLVDFAGSGWDLLLAYLALMRAAKKNLPPGEFEQYNPRLYAMDASVLAVATLKSFARRAGFAVNAVTGDSLVLDNGSPRFPGVHFDRILGNVPSLAAEMPEGPAAHPSQIWDGYVWPMIERFLRDAVTVGSSDSRFWLWGALVDGEAEGDPIQNKLEALGMTVRPQTGRDFAPEEIGPFGGPGGKTIVYRLYDARKDGKAELRTKALQAIPAIKTLDALAYFLLAVDGLGVLSEVLPKAPPAVEPELKKAFAAKDTAEIEASINAVRWFKFFTKNSWLAVRSAVFKRYQEILGPRIQKLVEAAEKVQDEETYYLANKILIADTQLSAREEELMRQHAWLQDLKDYRAVMALEFIHPEFKLWVLEDLQEVLLVLQKKAFEFEHQRTMRRYDEMFSLTDKIRKIKDRDALEMALWIILGKLSEPLEARYEAPLKVLEKAFGVTGLAAVRQTLRSQNREFIRTMVGMAVQRAMQREQIAEYRAEIEALPDDDPFKRFLLEAFDALEDNTRRFLRQIGEDDEADDLGRRDELRSDEAHEEAPAPAAPEEVRRNLEAAAALLAPEAEDVLTHAEPFLSGTGDAIAQTGVIRAYEFHPPQWEDLKFSLTVAPDKLGLHPGDVINPEVESFAPYTRPGEPKSLANLRIAQGTFDRSLAEFLGKLLRGTYNDELGIQWRYLPAPRKTEELAAALQHALRYAEPAYVVLRSGEQKAVWKSDAQVRMKIGFKKGEPVWGWEPEEPEYPRFLYKEFGESFDQSKAWDILYLHGHPPGTAGQDLHERLDLSLADRLMILRQFKSAQKPNARWLHKAFGVTSLAKGEKGTTLLVRLYTVTSDKEPEFWYQDGLITRNGDGVVSFKMLEKIKRYDRGPDDYYGYEPGGSGPGEGPDGGKPVRNPPKAPLGGTNSGGWSGERETSMPGVGHDTGLVGSGAGARGLKSEMRLNELVKYLHGLFQSAEQRNIVELQMKGPQENVEWLRARIEAEPDVFGLDAEGKTALNDVLADYRPGNYANARGLDALNAAAGSTFNGQQLLASLRYFAESPAEVRGRALALNAIREGQERLEREIADENHFWTVPEVETLLRLLAMSSEAGQGREVQAATALYQRDLKTLNRMIAAAAELDRAANAGIMANVHAYLRTQQTDLARLRGIIQEGPLRAASVTRPLHELGQRERGELMLPFIAAEMLFSAMERAANAFLESRPEIMTQETAVRMTVVPLMSEIAQRKIIGITLAHFLADATQPRLREVDLVEAARELVDNMKTRWQTTDGTPFLSHVNYQFEGDVAEPIVALESSLDGFFRIFGEPLKNALTALPRETGTLFRSGTVRVIFKKEAGRVKILVLNPGHPDPELDAEKIFLPHRSSRAESEIDIGRAGDHTGPFTGQGIGLFRARLLARLHGGDLEYLPSMREDATGQPVTAFQITFPLPGGESEAGAPETRRLLPGDRVVLDLGAESAPAVLRIGQLELELSRSDRGDNIEILHDRVTTYLEAGRWRSYRRVYSNPDQGPSTEALAALKHILSAAFFQERFGAGSMLVMDGEGMSEGTHFPRGVDPETVPLAPVKLTHLGNGLVSIEVPHDARALIEVEGVRASDDSRLTVLARHPAQLISPRVTVADDLTGAHNVASGILKAYGKKSLVIDDVEDLDQGRVPADHEIVINTKAGALTAAQAKERNAFLAKALKAMGKTPDIKVDYALRNLKQAMEGLYDAFAFDVLFFVPAMPNLGSKIENGRHFLLQDGAWIPTHQSSTAQKSTRPVTTSDVKAYVASELGIAPEKIVTVPGAVVAQGADAVSAFLAAQTLAPGTIVIPDIRGEREAGQADFQSVALAAVRLEREGKTVLRAGSSDFIRALMEAGNGGRKPAKASEPLAPLKRQGAPVALLGTLNAVTDQQVDEARRHFGDQLLLLEMDVAAVLERGPKLRDEFLRLRRALFQALQEGRPVILRTSRVSQELSRADAIFVAQSLGQILNGDEVRSKITALFVSGGETLGALTSVMTPSGITLEGEFADRVPWGIFYGGLANGIPVVSKQGGNALYPDILTQFFTQTSRYHQGAAAQAVSDLRFILGELGVPGLQVLLGGPYAQDQRSPERKLELALFLGEEVKERERARIFHAWDTIKERIALELAGRGYGAPQFHESHPPTTEQYLKLWSTRQIFKDSKTLWLVNAAGSEKMERAELRAAQDPALEARVQHYGQEIFAHAKAHRLTRLVRNASPSQFMMRLSSRDEYTKVQLLNFIGLLSNVGQNPQAVLKGLAEYFPFSDRKILLSVRFGTALARVLGGVFPRAVSSFIFWSVKTFVAKRFFAGENLDQARVSIKKIHGKGPGVTVDVLGEKVLSQDGTDAYIAEYERLVGTREIENVSIKLSSLYSEFNSAAPEKTKARVKEELKKVIRRIQETGTTLSGEPIFLTVDMEEYKDKDLIIQIFKEAAQETGFHNIGIAIQAYLKGTDPQDNETQRDLRGIAEFGRQNGFRPVVRLVKGAYWDQEVAIARRNDWPVPVFEHKHETDINYEESVRLILQNIDGIQPAFATHNIRSMAVVMAEAERLGIPKDQFEFQALYGMIPDEVVATLLEMGYRVRIYTPYGELLPGLGYLVRRILENSANASFLKNLSFKKKDIEAQLRDPRALVAVPPAPKPEEPVVIPAALEKRLAALERLANLWEGEPEAARRIHALVRERRALEQKAAASVLTVPGEANRYRYIPRGPGAVIIEDALNIPDLVEMLAAPLAGGNQVKVSLPTGVSPSTRQLIANVFDSAGFTRGEIEILDGVPGRAEQLAAQPELTWISYRGPPERENQFRRIVYSHLLDQNTPKRFVTQVTPDYAAEFVMGKSESQNTMAMGFATTLQKTGGEPGFTNESPVPLFRPENQRLMEEALARARAAFGKEYPLFIGGEEVILTEFMNSTNPAHPDQVIGRVSKGTAAHAAAAVKAAKAAFEGTEGVQGWGKKSAEERAAYLRKAAHIMAERKFDLAAVIVLEVGKTWRESLADVDEAIDFLNYYAANILTLEQEDQALAASDPRWANFKRAPNGVTAVVAPWNFPLAILTGMASGALAAGNTVILKPAGQSMVIAAKLMEIYRDAGFPAGVVNFVPGPGREVGGRLVGHEDVDTVVFTGSREVGLGMVEQAAASDRAGKRPKNVIAEMGGKNAVIVDESADLDQAVDGVINSAFSYCGQKCSAGSRVIVMREVYDKFTAKLRAKFEALNIGSPEEPDTLFGPVIDPAARQTIERQFKEHARDTEHLAVLAERKLVPEGRIDPAGSYVDPIIYLDVKRDSKLAREEIFGPVLVVMPAETFDEALSIANDTAFGLTGSLYSRIPSHIERYRDEVLVGNAYIERGSTGALVGWHPFGGYKQSGIGSKAGGRDYLMQFMHWEDTGASRPEMRSGIDMTALPGKLKALHAEAKRKLADAHEYHEKLNVMKQYQIDLEKLMGELYRSGRNWKETVAAMNLAEQLWKQEGWEPQFGRFLQHFILSQKMFMEVGQYQDLQEDVFRLVSQAGEPEDRLWAWWVYLAASTYHLRYFGLHVEARQDNNKLVVVDQQLIQKIMVEYFMPEFLKWRKEKAAEIAREGTAEHRTYRAMLWMLGSVFDYRIYDSESLAFSYASSNDRERRNKRFEYLRDPKEFFPGGPAESIPYFLKPMLAAAPEAEMKALLQEILEMRGRDVSAGRPEYIWDGANPRMRLIAAGILALGSGMEQLMHMPQESLDALAKESESNLLMLNATSQFRVGPYQALEEALHTAPSLADVPARLAEKTKPEFLISWPDFEARLQRQVQILKGGNLGIRNVDVANDYVEVVFGETGRRALEAMRRMLGILHGDFHRNPLGLRERPLESWGQIRPGTILKHYKRVQKDEPASWKTFYVMDVLPGENQDLDSAFVVSDDGKPRLLSRRGMERRLPEFQLVIPGVQPGVLQNPLVLLAPDADAEAVIRGILEKWVGGPEVIVPAQFKRGKELSGIAKKLAAVSGPIQPSDVNNAFREARLNFKTKGKGADIAAEINAALGRNETKTELRSANPRLLRILDYLAANPELQVRLQYPNDWPDSSRVEITGPLDYFGIKAAFGSVTENYEVKEDERFVFWDAEFAAYLAGQNRLYASPELPKSELRSDEQWPELEYVQSRIDLLNSAAQGWPNASPESLRSLVKGIRTLQAVLRAMEFKTPAVDWAGYEQSRKAKLARLQALEKSLRNVLLNRYVPWNLFGGLVLGIAAVAVMAVLKVPVMGIAVAVVFGGSFLLGTVFHIETLLVEGAIQQSAVPEFLHAEERAELRIGESAQFPDETDLKRRIHAFWEDYILNGVVYTGTDERYLPSIREHGLTSDEKSKPYDEEDYRFLRELAARASRPDAQGDYRQHAIVDFPSWSGFYITDDFRTAFSYAQRGPERVMLLERFLSTLIDYYDRGQVDPSVTRGDMERIRGLHEKYKTQRTGGVPVVIQIPMQRILPLLPEPMRGELQRYEAFEAQILARVRQFPMVDIGFIMKDIYLAGLLRNKGIEGTLPFTEDMRVIPYPPTFGEYHGELRAAPRPEMRATAAPKPASPQFFLETGFGPHGSVHSVYLLDPRINPARDKFTHHAITLRLGPGHYSEDYRDQTIVYDFFVTDKPYPADRDRLIDQSGYKGHAALQFDGEGRLESWRIDISGRRRAAFPWLEASLVRWLKSQKGKKFDRSNTDFPALSSLHPLYEKADRLLDRFKANGVLPADEERLAGEFAALGLNAAPALVDLVEFAHEAQDRNAALRVAVRALRMIGAPAAPQLIDALKRARDEETRADLLKALSGMKRAAVPALMAALRDPALRPYAASILQKTDPRRPTAITVSPIADFAQFKIPDEGTLPKKNILVYGGLGAVIPRFYKEHIEKLARRYNVELVALDLMPDDLARQRIESQGLPYSTYFQVPQGSPLFGQLGEFLKALLAEDPTGVLLVTRPNSHLDFVRWATENDMNVFVEKPVVLPGHVPALREVYRQHPDKVFAIDFFFDNKSALDGFELLKAKNFGALKSVNGRMIESNGIEKGREWLVNPRVSGGGLGMDMLVHLSALGDLLLSKFGLSLKDLELHPDESFLSRYEGAPEETETYARVAGHVKGVLVDLGAGKGAHTSAYYMILEGTKGTLEINLGTEKTPPFLELRDLRGRVVYHQDYGPDIGYYGTVGKIFDEAQGLGQVKQSERDFRMQATTRAVEVLEEAQQIVGEQYQSHKLGEDPDAAPRKAAPAVPKVDYPYRVVLPNAKHPGEEVQLVQVSTHEPGRFYWGIVGPHVEYEGVTVQFTKKRLVVSNLKFPENDLEDGNAVAVSILRWLLREARKYYPDAEHPLEITGVQTTEMMRIAEEVFEPESVEVYHAIEEKWRKPSEPGFDLYRAYGPVSLDFHDGSIKASRNGTGYKVDSNVSDAEVVLDGHKMTVRRDGRRVNTSFLVSFEMRGRPLAAALAEPMHAELRAVPLPQLAEAANEYLDGGRPDEAETLLTQQIAPLLRRSLGDSATAPENIAAGREVLYAYSKLIGARAGEIQAVTALEGTEGRERGAKMLAALEERVKESVEFLRHEKLRRERWSAAVQAEFEYLSAGLAGAYIAAAEKLLAAPEGDEAASRQAAARAWLDHAEGDLQAYEKYVRANSLYGEPFRMLTEWQARLAAARRLLPAAPAGEPETAAAAKPAVLPAAGPLLTDLTRQVHDLLNQQKREEAERVLTTEAAPLMRRYLEDSTGLPELPIKAGSYVVAGYNRLVRGTALFITAEPDLNGTQGREWAAEWLQHLDALIAETGFFLNHPKHRTAPWFDEATFNFHRNSLGVAQAYLSAAEKLMKSLDNDDASARKAAAETWLTRADKDLGFYEVFLRRYRMAPSFFDEFRTVQSRARALRETAFTEKPPAPAAKSVIAAEPNLPAMVKIMHQQLSGGMPDEAEALLLDKIGPLMRQYLTDSHDLPVIQISTGSYVTSGYSKLVGIRGEQLRTSTDEFEGREGRERAARLVERLERLNQEGRDILKHPKHRETEWHSRAQFYFNLVSADFAAAHVAAAEKLMKNLEGDDAEARKAQAKAWLELAEGELRVHDLFLQRQKLQPKYHDFLALWQERARQLRQRFFTEVQAVRETVPAPADGKSMAAVTTLAKPAGAAPAAVPPAVRQAPPAAKKPAEEVRSEPVRSREPQKKELTREIAGTIAAKVLHDLNQAKGDFAELADLEAFLVRQEGRAQKRHGIVSAGLTDPELKLLKSPEITAKAVAQLVTAIEEVRKKLAGGENAEEAAEPVKKGGRARRGEAPEEITAPQPSPGEEAPKKRDRAEKAAKKLDGKKDPRGHMRDLRDAVRSVRDGDTSEVRKLFPRAKQIMLRWDAHGNKTDVKEHLRAFRAAEALLHEEPAALKSELRMAEPRKIDRAGGLGNYVKEAVRRAPRYQVWGKQFFLSPDLPYDLPPESLAQAPAFVRQAIDHLRTRLIDQKGSHPMALAQAISLVEIEHWRREDEQFDAKRYQKLFQQLFESPLWLDEIANPEGKISIVLLGNTPDASHYIVWRGKDRNFAISNVSSMGRYAIRIREGTFKAMMDNHDPAALAILILRGVFRIFIREASKVQGWQDEMGIDEEVAVEILRYVADSRASIDSYKKYYEQEEQKLRDARREQSLALIGEMRRQFGAETARPYDVITFMTQRKNHKKTVTNKQFPFYLSEIEQAVREEKIYGASYGAGRHGAAFRIYLGFEPEDLNTEVALSPEEALHLFLDHTLIAVTNEIRKGALAVDTHGTQLKKENYEEFADAFSWKGMDFLKEQIKTGRLQLVRRQGNFVKLRVADIGEYLPKAELRVASAPRQVYVPRFTWGKKDDWTTNWKEYLEALWKKYAGTDDVRKVSFFAESTHGLFHDFQPEPRAEESLALPVYDNKKKLVGEIHVVVLDAHTNAVAMLRLVKPGELTDETDASGVEARIASKWKGWAKVPFVTQFDSGVEMGLMSTVRPIEDIHRELLAALRGLWEKAQAQARGEGRVVVDFPVPASVTPDRAELREAAPENLNLYFAAQYPASLEAVRSVYDEVARQTLSNVHPRWVLEAFLNLYAPSARDQVLDQSHPLFQAARKAMGEYAWLLDGDASSHVQLIMRLPAGEDYAAYRASIVLALGRGDRISFVAPGMDEAQTEAARRAFLGPLEKVFGTALAADRNIRIVPTPAGRAEVLRAIQRFAADHSFAGESGVLDTDKAFLQEVGFRGSKLLLNPEQLRREVAVVITAALLRSQLPDTYSIVELDQWMREKGLDADTLVARVSQMIQAIESFTASA